MRGLRPTTSCIVQPVSCVNAGLTHSIAPSAPAMRIAFAADSHATVRRRIFS